MSRWHQMEGTIFEMSSTFPPHRDAEIGIVFSPDHFDRKIERLDQRQAGAVSLQLLVELRPHLHESRTGTWLHREIVGDDQSYELFEVQFLVRRKRLGEFHSLPVQQSAELRRALRDSERERLQRRIGKQ